jgi:hypothetical protein
VTDTGGRNELVERFPRDHRDYRRIAFDTIWLG